MKKKSGSKKTKDGVFKFTQMVIDKKKIAGRDLHKREMQEKILLEQNLRLNLGQ